MALFNNTKTHEPYNDSAFFRDLNEVGVRVVIRNHLGLLLASMSDKFALPSLLNTVECMGVVQALRFVGDCGFSSTILEDDHKAMTKSLRCEDKSFSTCR